jgi:hypothetical protein
MEPRYAFSFSLKSPSIRTPSRFPSRAPTERAARVQGIFLHIFQIPRKKFSQIKKFFPSLKGPRKGAFLHVPQKRGTYENRRPFLETYLAYPSESPIKEPALQVPLTELPRRHAAFLEPSFILLSKSPLYEPPYRFPCKKTTWPSIWRHIPEFFSLQTTTHFTAEDSH